MVKTYLADKRSDRSPEDSMECPLASLGLMSSFRELSEDDKRVTVYRYEPGSAANIHPLIFLYAILHRQNVEREGARQVGLQAVLRDPMNAGRTFNIGLIDFEHLLGRLNDQYNWRIALTRTGGLDHLTLPDVYTDVVLRELYESTSFTNVDLRECWIQAIG